MIFDLVCFNALLVCFYTCLHLQAKDAASVQDKWLLLNLQSTKEFSSHMVVSKHSNLCLFLLVKYDCFVWAYSLGTVTLILWSLIGIHGQMKLFLKLLVPILFSGRSVSCLDRVQFCDMFFSSYCYLVFFYFEQNILCANHQKVRLEEASNENLPNIGKCKEAFCGF